MVSSGIRNVGEWTEFPAGLEAIRQSLNVAGNSLKYLVGESMDGTKLTYSFDGDGNLVLDDVIALSNSQYIEMRKILYQGMRRRGRVKAIPKFDPYWSTIGFPKLKAGSGPKADLVFITDVGSEVGLSVKSLMGKRPTLLNPGRATTRIRYRISGTLPKDRTNDKAMCRQLTGLEFYEICDDTFSANLTAISKDLPTVLGVAVGDYFTGGPSKLSELSNETRAELEKLLLASACGMVPKTPYDFSRPVTKILLVKSDWKFVLIDLEDVSTVSTFLDLFRFEQPSRSVKKYDYGQIFEHCGDFFIDFVLQIRM